MGTIFRRIFAALALSLALAGLAQADQVSVTCTENCSAPYVPNEFWTTGYGPAYANVLLQPSNFLSCSATAYALCYYSGPGGEVNSSTPVLPCRADPANPRSANCRCYAQTGVSYVLIHAIRNTEAYVETVRACGLNGEKCANMAAEAAGKLLTQLGASSPTPLPQAPVCRYLQPGADGRVKMAPGAELISTFSQAQSSHYDTGMTQCTGAQAGPYAGCMTASCTYEKDAGGQRTGFATCRCPIYNGPFQVGQKNAACKLGGGNVWSAAYAPGQQN